MSKRTEDYEAFLARSAEIERRVNDGESIGEIISSHVRGRNEELLRKALAQDEEDRSGPDPRRGSR